MSSAIVSDDEGTASLVIPIIEETLLVDKKTVDSGGYRVKKQVVLRDTLVEEMLRTQRLEVERRAVGRVLDTLEAPTPRQEGDTLVISVIEEIVVTEKRLLLKEEIRITQIQVDTPFSQTVSLQSEEITVERLEPR